MTPRKLSLSRLRLLALVEGLSLLVLLGIAVPLKHLFGVPKATTIVGAIHGIAFVAYLVAVLDALVTRQLTPRQAGLAVVAAMVPGGSFAFRRTLRAQDDERHGKS